MIDTSSRSLGAGLEPWQDARRTPALYTCAAPDIPEWWYFDAQLADGRALVAAFLIVFGVTVAVDLEGATRLDAGQHTHQALGDAIFKRMPRAMSSLLALADAR
jgi:hypothetical protein